jgi:hypothetical protein
MNSGFINQLNVLLDANHQSIDQIDPALRNLAELGLSIFLTKEDFLHWVINPSIDCQGRCPKDFMNSISEIKELTSILNRISHGIPY